MTDIVIFLVFSIVMLLFMAFPAIKIVEFFDEKYQFSDKTRNSLILILTVVLSLMVGAFLKYFDL